MVGTAPELIEVGGGSVAGQASAGGGPTHLTVPIAPRKTESSYAEAVDLEVVVTFGVILLGGFALGTLLNVGGPRDDEAAAMHRDLVRRALGWLPGRFQANEITVHPRRSSSPYG